jgi:hypothetical protein
MTQIAKLAKLLQRKQGCTMYEVCLLCNSTTPTRRLSDLRDLGWSIKKIKIQGKNYHRFYGKPPKNKQLKGIL